MTLKSIHLFVFLLLTTNFLSAQSAFINYDVNYYHQLERLEIKSGRLSNDFHVNVKPFERKEIIRFLTDLNTDSLSFSKVDLWNLEYLKQDSWEWIEDSIKANEKPFLKHLFKQKSDFYYASNEDFDIHVNPIFNFGGGNNIAEAYVQHQFVNTRGIAVRGTVNKKLGFYTTFTENQSSSPQFVKDYYAQTNGFPFIGFHKIINDDNERLSKDYLQATGYLAFRPSKNILLRFGHSKNFIGSGVRSMILSDFSAPYLNLMLNVDLGRLQYVSILARMSNAQEDIGVANLKAIPSKYMTFHHLNVNVFRNLNIGLFETVMFGNREFDLNYLNPVIFYRFVEGLIGSTDNAIVGADFKLNAGRALSLYGQLVLDEFNLEENKKDGWYGKKNAGQIGLKYINAFGLKQFDLQLEYNYARPYTYGHFSTYSNLVNYNASIAHPLGANFKELIGIARYQPIPKLFLKATWLNYMKGYDVGAENWGGDIFKNNRDNKPNDYGNFVGQGERRWTSLLRYEASYMLGHNFFLDLSYQTRKTKTAEKELSNFSLFEFGVRWNIARQTALF